MTDQITTTSDTIAEEVRPRSAVSRILLGRDGVMVAILVLVVVIASVAVARFASPVTVGYLLLNALPALLIALPMTLIIITGEIDLSVASIVGLSTATLGTLTLAGWDFVPAVLVAVGAGLLAGVLNGALIAFLGLPSLAVTIGTLALFRGLALVLIGDRSVPASEHPAEVTAFVTSKLGGTGIPTVMIFVVIVIAAFALLLHFTPFGRGLYAIGYSKEAARFVGIHVARSKFWLYVASGGISGLVGIYWALYYSARSDSGAGLELTVIAAVLLGGVSIFGGRGTIVGAITGVLLISTINYALRLQRIPDVTLVIVTGTLLILSVVAPSVFASARQWLHVRRVQRTLPRLNRTEASGA